AADLGSWRRRAGDLFAAVAAERGGASHRGALLMAADLRGRDLAGADLLGADLRDADVRGADLSTALFLTQPQVNATRGDAGTLLPDRLVRPALWEAVNNR
ncbi:MAG TPA: pentapeptide repeat-containing protein, partial [Nocardioides sp.]|uniref:pentapeptide repeat-containing protein n=1 Tax=Nocardioides sp. TaxID=35761 RepID=UPI002D0A6ED2